jgi:tetratricopeptide (TPR) repeat protein
MSDLADDSLLSRAERLVLDERYDEGLQEIGRLRQNKVEIGAELRCGILESRCFTGLGEFNNAIKAAQNVVDLGSKFQEQKMDVIDGLLEMAAAAWDLGLSDMILEKCNQAEKLRMELMSDDESVIESVKADILFHESIGWNLKDNQQKGVEMLQESLSIREGVGDVQGIVSVLLRLGFFHMMVDNNQAIEYVERALMLNRELGHKGPIIFGQGVKAFIELLRCNWDECEQLTQHAMMLVKRHNHRRWMLWMLFLFSNLYLTKGDFRQAEEYLQEYLFLSEKTDAQLHINMACALRGEIFRIQGEFEKALEDYERSMEIGRRIGRIRGYIETLADCGMIQNAMGDADKALTILEESLELAERQEQSGLLGGHYRSFTLLEIVSILVDKGLIDRAQERVERVREISEETGALYDRQAYIIAEALVLKSSILPRSRIMAKEHLAEVVDGTFFDYQLSVLALLNLTEILVNELQMTGDSDLLGILEARLAKLLKLANEQGSTLLLVETLLLQFKFALLQLDSDKASQLLNHARSLARQKGFHGISKRIADEHDIMLNELSIWKNLGENKPSMIERVEMIRMHEQISDMIKQGTWRRMLF